MENNQANSQLANEQHIIVQENVPALHDKCFLNNCTMETISLPQKLHTIGQKAFWGCIMLRELQLPDGVTTIGDEAFRRCDSLRSLEIPDSVTRFGRYVFGRCTALEHVKLPSRLATLPELTFAGCQSLKTVEFPTNLVRIENRAFQGCEALTELTLPESVEKIDFNAFWNCTSLKILRLPITAKSVDAFMLEGCTALEKIELYGELPQDQPVPKWIENLILDKRSNAREMLEKCGRLNPDSVHLVMKLNATRFMMNVAFSQNGIMDKKEAVLTVFDQAKDLYTLVSELQKIISFKQIGAVLQAAQDYVYSMPRGELSDGTKLTCGHSCKTQSRYPLTSIPDYMELEGVSFYIYRNAISEISDGVFQKCKNLKVIFYEGSRSEWESIIIGTNNEPLRNAFLICNQPEIKSHAFF